MRAFLSCACLGLLMAGAAFAQPTQETCEASFPMGAGPADFLPFAFEKGPYVDANGDCALDDLRLTLGARAYQIASVDALRWRGQGLERIQDSRPPEQLSIDFTRFIVIPHIPDAQALSHLYELQSQAFPGISGTVALALDEDAGRLTSEGQVDFTDLGAITWTSALSDITATDLALMRDTLPDARLHDLTLEITSNGLFEQHVLIPLGMMLLHDAGDPAKQVTRLKTEAKTAIAALPDQSFDESTRAAFAAVIDAMPHPDGTLRVELRSEPGIDLGVAALLTGDLPDEDSVLGLLQGLTVTATWTEGD